MDVHTVLVCMALGWTALAILMINPSCMEAPLVGGKRWGQRRCCTPCPSGPQQLIAVSQR